MLSVIVGMMYIDIYWTANWLHQDLLESEGLAEPDMAML
jgi:hypothetical protein